jgi:HlyD family secretion protein
MSSDPRRQLPTSPGKLLQDVDALVDELAKLAASGVDEADFHESLLRRAVEGTAALGAGVWLQDDDGCLRLRYDIALSAWRSEVSSAEDSPGVAVFREILRQARPRAVNPGSHPELEAAWPHDPDAVLLLAPFRIANGAQGLLGLLQRPGVPAESQAGYLRFVGVLGELAVEFHRGRRIRELEALAKFWAEVDGFAQGVHGSLDLPSVASGITNEGQRVLACDRVGVAARRKDRYRLVAISGVDSVNRRGAMCRRLEHLAELVAADGRPLWWSADHREMPPELEQPLHDYLDESHARALGILPLVAPADSSWNERADDDAFAGQPVGLMVVEQFTSAGVEDLSRRVDALLPHAAVALRRGVEFEQFPRTWIGRTLWRFGWSARSWGRRKFALVAAVFAGAMLCAAIIPAELKVEAPGRLQPLHRRHVFAPADGVVDRLAATEPGERMDAGEALAVIRSPELDLEIERVKGQIETASKRMAAVQVERTKIERGSRSDRGEMTRLTAEKEELKIAIEGFRRQEDILSGRRRQLDVVAPIDGRVITWDVFRLLEARPVVQGQILMTMADLQGPWIVELRIPDDRVGQVIDGRRTGDGRLPVSFIIATDPSVTHRGELAELALASDADQEGPPFVRATAAVAQGLSADRLRPGATVVAKIHCGRRSILYVWSRGVVDFVRARLLF